MFVLPRREFRVCVATARDVCVCAVCLFLCAVLACLGCCKACSRGVPDNCPVSMLNALELGMRMHDHSIPWWFGSLVLGANV